MDVIRPKEAEASNGTVGVGNESEDCSTQHVTTMENVQMENVTQPVGIVDLAGKLAVMRMMVQPTNSARDGGGSPRVAVQTAILQHDGVPWGQRHSPIKSLKARWKERGNLVELSAMVRQRGGGNHHMHGGGEEWRESWEW